MKAKMPAIVTPAMRLAGTAWDVPDEEIVPAPRGGEFVLEEDVKIGDRSRDDSETVVVDGDVVGKEALLAGTDVFAWEGVGILRDEEVLAEIVVDSFSVVEWVLSCAVGAVLDVVDGVEVAKDVVENVWHLGQ